MSGVDGLTRPTEESAGAERFAPNPPSYWRELAPRSVTDAFIPSRSVADLVVVGLGAPGLLAARIAAAAGARVVGVDAGAVGRGAAAANGGFLLAGGSRFFHEAASTWGRARAERLWSATVDEFDTEVAELDGLGVRFRRCGSLRVAGHPYPPVVTAGAAEDVAGDEVADLRDHAAALRDFGVDVRDRVVGGAPALFVPSDGWVDPARRVDALALQAVRAGARLYEGERVMRIEPGRVVTDVREIACSFVLVCVDGHLEELVPGLPVRSQQLQMIRVATSSGGRLPLPTYMRFGFEYGIDLDESTHGGGFVLGGFRDRHPEESSCSRFSGPAMPSAGVQHDLDTLAATITGVPVTVTTRWSASVSYTEDGWPLVTEAMPGVWVVGGFSGHGNLIGPLAARTIARMLTGGGADASSARELLGWLAR